MEGHCEVLSLRSHDRAPYGAFVMLERRAVKVACVVLRGLGEGDLAWLPGDDSDGTETSGRRNRMDQTSTDQILHQLLEEQKRLLEALTNQRPKSKDVWDRFAALSPLISGLAVALVGAVFTGIYSSRQSEIQKELQSHQNRILEMQTIEGFLPHLSSGNVSTQKAAVIAIGELSSPALAARIGALFNSAGTKAGAEALMASATPSSAAQLVPVD
jgi:hypothetical protein